MELALIVVGVLLLLVGFAGIFLPVIPSLSLAWAGFFLIALASSFESISVFTTLVFLVLVVLASVFDVLLPVFGAKWGASGRAAAFGASVGAIAGIFLLGPVGLIAGVFLGGILGELLITGNMSRAMRAGAGVAFGILMSAAFKVGLVVAMVAVVVTSFF